MGDFKITTGKNPSKFVEKLSQSLKILKDEGIYDFIHSGTTIIVATTSLTCCNYEDIYKYMISLKITHYNYHYHPSIAHAVRIIYTEDVFNVKFCKLIHAKNAVYTVLTARCKKIC